MDRMKFTHRESGIMARPTLLLADDHQLLLDALKNLLSASYEVVGTVTDGRTLVTVAKELQPDVIVLDISMPHLNGLEAGRQLRKLIPKAKLVFLTMNDDPFLVEEAFRLGASGFLLKQGSAQQLMDAIDHVLIGGSYVPPAIAEILANLPVLDPRYRDHSPQPTPRQCEVLQLLAEGRSMKQIGMTLDITARTVAAHKYAAMELLRLKTNAELVRYAIKCRVNWS
jgi:DNA-binding NarL/FixJ family response regulator